MSIVLGIVIIVVIFGHLIWKEIRDNKISSIEKIIFACITFVIVWNSVLPGVALATCYLIWRFLHFSVTRYALLFLIICSAIFSLIICVFTMNFSYGSIRSSAMLFMKLVTYILPIFVFIVRFKPSTLLCNTTSEAYWRIGIIWLAAFMFRYVFMFLFESFEALAD